MNKLWPTLCLLIGLTSLGFAQTKTVEGTSSGDYYNEAQKRWKEYPIIVYVDIRGNIYIKGGEDRIIARGLLWEEQREEFIDLLKKSSSWAERVRKEQLEFKKVLGNFMHGRGDEADGIKLTFFSADKGEQTDVVMLIRDFKHPSDELELYLSQKQVKELIILLEKVLQTLQELQEQVKSIKKFQ